MSWYHSYYIGIKTKDNKLYPIGPFNSAGRPLPIVENSRSFEPETLDNDFIPVKENMVSDNFKDAFGYTNDETGKTELDLKYISYLPVEHLPKGDGLRFGYFLIDEVQRYQKIVEEEGTPFDFDGFYDWMTPDVYRAKALNEIQFGAPMEVEDDEGYNVTPRSCVEYMPFAYIDYSSAAYMAEKMRMAHYVYSDYELDRDFGDDWQRVIILSQG